MLLPIFRFDKALDVARSARAFLNPGIMRGAAADAERRENQTENPKTARRRTAEQGTKIKSKKRELRRKKQELRKIRSEASAATDGAERYEGKKRSRTLLQEIFRLERELRAAKNERAEGEPQTGALPDFLIIGAMKGGTTFLYHLLTQHPLVESALKKELHFFDHDYELGVEWYRRYFPAPRLKDGRKTITGEASPYLSDPLAPERIAEVVPRARLIALLRNPVDRAYSHYQQAVRKGTEPLSFEEAIGAEKVQPVGGESEVPKHWDFASLKDSRRKYLLKGTYADQLLRWTEFFNKEQLLVLKSEDFFEHPQQTLRTTLEFLGLPEHWEPDPSEIVPKRRNKGGYEQEINPATRRYLEEYFEPHNKRLYDFLGRDFGW